MVEEHGRSGRPRSERARRAVLNAADDLLVEIGYAALTMKGIAERAGVGRQTVYRWWSSKAEILYEASAIDAQQELAVPLTDDPSEDLAAYLDAFVEFLVNSHAGAAYRALIGEAQHDKVVAALLSSRDILGESAARVVGPALDASDSALSVEQATAFLIGPPFFHILSGRSAESVDTRQLAREFLRVLGVR
ncbi:TetR family transcriptional regulator [Streptomyces sp. CB02923]|uniref:TetR/AcrR family transcriptional regulator n=1 Tax=Streptomyces sp. CB02923 TaxID=1718985 RepID=UPI0009401E5B|nr:TetR/AcrR family transcriptional regulator [Streptomyces sp. CB02923]OKI04851.1 TetR family transcriptional regulator [Streptomyces sp. CB02923]